MVSLEPSPRETLLVFIISTLFERTVIEIFCCLVLYLTIQGVKESKTSDPGEDWEKDGSLFSGAKDVQSCLKEKKERMPSENDDLSNCHCLEVPSDSKEDCNGSKEVKSAGTSPTNHNASQGSKKEVGLSCGVGRGGSCEGGSGGDGDDGDDEEDKRKPADYLEANETDEDKEEKEANEKEEKEEGVCEGGVEMKKPEVKLSVEEKCLEDGNPPAENGIETQPIENQNKGISSSKDVIEKEEKFQDMANWNRHFVATFHCWRHNGYQTCSHQPCRAIHETLTHGLNCMFKIVINGCLMCKKIVQLHIFHARSCTERGCPVPTCANLKRDLPPILNQDNPIASGLQLVEQIQFQEWILGSPKYMTSWPFSHSSDCQSFYGYNEEQPSGSILSPLNQMYLRPKNLQYRELLEWRLLLYLGGGRFGRCHLGEDLNTERKFVIKKVSEKEFDMEEIRIHKHCSNISPEVLEFLGAMRMNGEIYLFLEYMPAGSVQEVLERYGAFEEKQTCYIIYKVLLALGRIHAYGIIFRDIKGSNVLMSADGRSVKLGDFGSALQLPAGKTETEAGLSPVGTENFMDKRVARSEPYGVEADIWSCGIFLHQMITGKIPWEDHHGSTLYLVATSGHPEIPPCSDPLKDVFESCYSPPESRPTAQDLRQFTCFKNIVCPSDLNYEHSNLQDGCSLSFPYQTSSEEDSE